MADPILIAQSKEPIFLLPKMANRHGLIAGATGTGKTVTLQTLAENFSARGVPVFMADVKGDLAGLSQPGGNNPNVVERAKWLAKVRDSEGYMAQFLPSEKDGPQILECHSPIFNLIEKYPIIGRLEQDMFEGVLGTSVRREETRTSGLYECAFYFAA